MIGADGLDAALRVSSALALAALVGLLWAGFQSMRE